MTHAKTGLSSSYFGIFTDSSPVEKTQTRELTLKKVEDLIVYSEIQLFFVFYM